MVERVSGPFEYFEVTGASVAEAVADPVAHAMTLRSIADDLDLDSARVRGAVEGDLESLVPRAPHEGARSARLLTQKALFASGCVREFARAVDRFDAEVAALNREYAAVAKSAKSDLGDLLLSPVGGADSVLASAKSRLLPRYRRARQALDDDADQVGAELDRGVDDDVVRRLVRQGLIPLVAAGVFDQLHLTEADRYVALAAMVADGRMPPEVLDDPDRLDAYLASHHDVAEAIADVSPALLATILPLGFHPSAKGAVDALAGLSAADRRRVAMLLPSLYGNNPHAPFDVRAQANRTSISAQIQRDADRIAELKRENRDEDGYGYAGASAIARRNEEIARLEGRRDVYHKMLNDHPVPDKDGRGPAHRQIVCFDPDADGRIAELHGVLDERTRNVGVLVPGTGTDLNGWDGTARRGREFVQAARGLAVISWMGGDLPDSIWRDAPNQKYAKELGPMLADFSHELRHEVDRVGASDVKTTYLGHSYGGAVVGQAEHMGLDADRVLMVEGAGMGPDVHDAGDLSARNRATQHYSMTAPGDPIEIAQVSGHLGSDPDDFGDAVRLRTGRFSDGEQIRGIGSHTSVFTKSSDAWRNMLAVMNGGIAQTWHQPDLVYNGQGYSVIDNPDSGGEVHVR